MIFHEFLHNLENFIFCAVILLEKRAIKDFKVGVNFHSFIPHFLFCIFFVRILL